MSEDSYFIISVSDSDVYVSEHTREELVTKFNDDYYGDGAKDFNEEIPTQNVFYWKSKGGAGSLIIKGKIVIPKAIQVATEYDIE